MQIHTRRLLPFARSWREKSYKKLFHPQLIATQPNSNGEGSDVYALLSLKGAEIARNIGLPVECKKFKISSSKLPSTESEGASMFIHSLNLNNNLLSKLSHNKPNQRDEIRKHLDTEPHWNENCNLVRYSVSAFIGVAGLLPTIAEPLILPIPIGLSCLIWKPLLSAHLKAHTSIRNYNLFARGLQEIMDKVTINQ